MAVHSVLLLIRPEGQAQALADALEVPSEVEVVVSPIMRIVPRAHAPVKAATLVITSAHAVPAAQAAAAERIYAVGDRSAAAATAVGLRAISAGGDADALVALVSKARPPEPIVHLRGAHTVGAVADRLRALGLKASDVIVYDQEAQELSEDARAALQGEVPVIVPLYSPRSARLFAEAAKGARAPIHAVAMSKSVAEALGTNVQVHLTLAAEPTGAAMHAAISQVLVKTSRLEANRTSR